MVSRRAVSRLKEVSNWKKEALISFLYLFYSEKIGGGYFLKIDPERYFELKLQNTDFIEEDRAVNGSDA